MAFWGCILKPGATAKVGQPEGDILHLSQACLHNPQDGKNYIQAEVEGKKYAIACLEKGKKEHDSFDLFFNPDSCAFSNVGKSEVHLTGYFEPDDMGDEGSEEEVPAIAARAASPKLSPKVAPVATKAASPKVAVAQSPKPATLSPKAQALKAQMDDDDDDLSDLECEEEEELIEDEDEEELDLSELEDEEEEEEEDCSESEEAPQPGKRKAEALGSPMKKPKVEPPKTPGSPKAGAVSGDIAEYGKKLVAYLKQNGKTNICELGSKVPRPKDAPKMKVFFEQNKDKFKVEGDFVSAAK